MDVKCEKCKTLMRKTHTLNAGNSRFECYTCPKCNHEKKLSMGPNQGGAKFS